MLKHASHGGGVSFKTEIQFQTRFDYMFPREARTPGCLLPPEVATLEARLDLGEAMSEATGAGTFDSDIPAGSTYLGQLIDHDITARTDRSVLAATDALVSRSSEGFAGAEEVGRVTESTRTGSTDVPASEEQESFVSVAVHHPGGTTHVKRLADFLAVASA